MDKLSEEYAIIFKKDYRKYGYSQVYSGFDAILVRLYESEPDYVVFAIPTWDSEEIYLIEKAMDIH